MTDEEREIALEKGADIYRAILGKVSYAEVRDGLVLMMAWHCLTGYIAHHGAKKAHLLATVEGSYRPEEPSPE